MNRLKTIKLAELSLVDHPANPHARVTLFKRDTSADQLDIRKSAINERLEKARVALLGKRIKMLKTDAAPQLKRKGSQKLKPINRIGYASS